jgi:hypothetical protein
MSATTYEIGDIVFSKYIGNQFRPSKVKTFIFTQLN